MEFKLNTPYAMVTVKVEKEDEWAYEDIMDFVCERVTGVSPKSIKEFYDKIEVAKQRINV